MMKLWIVSVIDHTLSTKGRKRMVTTYVTMGESAREAALKVATENTVMSEDEMVVCEATGLTVTASVAQMEPKVIQERVRSIGEATFFGVDFEENA